MRNFIPLLFSVIVATVLLPSCQKNCRGTGVFCVKNGYDTRLLYSWDSNMLTDTLLPGEKACLTDLTIHTDILGEEYETVYFNSGVGDYVFDVHKCNSQVTLEP